VELLDFLPFLVNRGDLSAVARQIATYQIQQADAAVFVCKDPADEKYLMGETFQPTMHRLLIRQFQLTDP